MEAKMIESNEQGFEQYFPTDADIAEIFGDDDEWEQCEFCGDDFPVGSTCDCNDGYGREPSEDFPLYMEYEGAYGLSGYDSFYDSCTEY